jgi:hypothetical protein
MLRRTAALALCGARNSLRPRSSGASATDPDLGAVNLCLRDSRGGHHACVVATSGG